MLRSVGWLLFCLPAYLLQTRWSLRTAPVQCGEAKAEMVLGHSTCPQSITEDARDTGDRVPITKMCAANTIVVEIADRASRDCRV